MTGGAATVVAIHQPNFFPWLGFFNKWARADVFVLLDHVQFPKTAGNWINHVQILNAGKPLWMTAPVVRAYHGVRRIDETEINDSTDWREKTRRTWRAQYGRARCFHEAFPLLDPLLAVRAPRLADYNLAVLAGLGRAIGLSTDRWRRSSTIGAAGTGTELLAALVKAVGGTHYLAGGGAGGYQEDAVFAREGLGLVPQGFTPTPYAQRGTDVFVPGLSIVDALMNVGVEATARLARGETL